MEREKKSKNIVKGKFSEEALKEAFERAKDERARTEAIIEAIGDGVSIQDTDYKLLYMNRVAVDMFGDHGGEYCYKVFEQRDQICPECPLALSFMDGKIHRVERSNPTRTLHVEITTSPIRDSNGNIIAGIEVVRDITKRKLAEEALRESEERYRDLFENAHDMIQSVDPNGRFIFVNKSWLQVMGYTPDDLKTITLFDILHPSCKPHCMEVFKEVMSGYAVNNIKATFIAKNGQLIDVEGNVNVRLSGGKVIATQGIFRDVTERKKMEEELFQVTSDWEDTFNTITDMITVHDKDFNIIRRNKAAEKILGLPFLEITRAKCYEYYHGTGSPPEGCPSCRALITGMPSASEILEPHLNMFIEIRAIPRFDSNNQLTGLIHIVRDISENKKLEEQLRQAQKMEALGQLTGGIAHDFNNLLTAIIGYASLLQSKMKEDDPLWTYVDQIRSSSRVAANLTQSLLAFSRKQIINPKPVDLNEIVKNLKKLLARLIGENIELKTMLAEDGLIAMADPGQIEQVLMNLCTNARDAMPEGGTLTIKTEGMELGEQFIKSHGYGKTGSYALISFTDTGVGMNEETRKRIFEPFFTTKEIGRGTGLGLAIVYGIVKQHNGYINVSSDLNKGTTFNVYLPLVKIKAGETK